MKLIYILFLTSSSLFSQNYYYTISGRLNSGGERNTKNLLCVETFENPELQTNFLSGDFYLEYALNHSFQIDKNFISEGSKSGRFEIKTNDPKIWGSTRAEMSQNQRSTLDEGWYGFSQYFPDTYVNDPTEEVVGQWHVQPDVGEFKARNPSNAIITGSDRIKWMIKWDADFIMTDSKADGIEYVDLGKIPKNRWIDWVVHIKYSHTNTGILEVWMDDVKVIDRRNMPNTYNDLAYPYFKFGVYKWEWGDSTSQRVIYYDEVRIGNKNSSYEEVKPGKNNRR